MASMNYFDSNWKNLTDVLKLSQKYHNKIHINNCYFHIDNYTVKGGRRGHDSMVVGFKTSYAISSYHH